MGKVIASITTSVDDYVTGPDDGPDLGLGRSQADPPRGRAYRWPTSGLGVAEGVE
jgi:hypothetical protein